MVNLEDVYYGTLNSNHEDALEHYGVLGMRWGVRHDRHYKRAIKNAKVDKKVRRITNKNDYLGKNANGKSSYLTSNNAARKAYKNAERQNKNTYKSEKKKYALDVANRLYPMNSSATNKKVLEEGKLKTAAKVALLGSYSALKYDQIRASGKGRAKTYIISKFSTVFSSSGSSKRAWNEYQQNIARREPASNEYRKDYPLYDHPSTQSKNVKK